MLYFVLHDINLQFTLSNSPTRICYSIFASRIILHIRGVDQEGLEDAFTLTTTRSVILTDVLSQSEMED